MKHFTQPSRTTVWLQNWAVFNTLPSPMCGRTKWKPPYPFWPLLLEEPPDAPTAETDDGEDDHGEQGDDHPAMKMKVVKAHIQLVLLKQHVIGEIAVLAVDNSFSSQPLSYLATQ